jgi:hypothetical protein
MGDFVMFTFHYNGAFINGYFDKPECYVTCDDGTFLGKRFKSCLAAKRAITMARHAGMPASQGIPEWGSGQA